VFRTSQRCLQCSSDIDNCSLQTRLSFSQRQTTCECVYL